MLWLNGSDPKLLFNQTFYIDAILESGNVKKTQNQQL